MLRRVLAALLFAGLYAPLAASMAYGAAPAHDCCRPAPKREAPADHACCRAALPAATELSAPIRPAALAAASHGVTGSADGSRSALVAAFVPARCFVAEPPSPSAQSPPRA